MQQLVLVHITFGAGVYCTETRCLLQMSVGANSS